MNYILIKKNLHKNNVYIIVLSNNRNSVKKNFLFILLLFLNAIYKKNNAKFGKSWKYFKYKF